jgi:hypothetical protein
MKQANPAIIRAVFAIPAVSAHRAACAIPAVSARRAACAPSALLLAFLVSFLTGAGCPTWAENLQLEYQVSQKQVSAPNPELKSVGSSTTESNSAGTLSVLLDDHSYREDSGHPQIYDFANKTCCLIKPDGKSYSQTSLYSLVAFVDTEIRNRQMLGSLLAHSGLEAKAITTFDQLWAAIELGITMPGAPENPGIIIEEQDGNIVCTYKDKVLTRVKLGEPCNSGKEMYTKFLVYNMRLHPLIRERIASTGRLCKEIDFLVARPSGAIDCISMRLTKSTPTSNKASLDQSMKRVFDSPSLVPFQEKLLSEPKSWTMPTRAETLTATQKFMDANNFLDAALTLAEYSLCTGDHAAADQKEIGLKLEQDKNVKLVFQKPDNTSIEALKEVLKKLQSIDTSTLSKGYIIDIFKADVMDSLQQDGSELLLNALKNNMLLTGVYRDLGDFWAERYETVKAWECYELARRLNASHPILEPVNKREQRLEKEHPEFF